MPVKFVFAAALITCSLIISAATADEIKVYEFMETNERLFELKGGIGNSNLTAKIGGNFKVKFNSNGTNEILSFDAYVFDAYNANLGESWKDGTRLEDILFASPVGTQIVSNCNLNYLCAIITEIEPTLVPITMTTQESLTNFVPSLFISPPPSFPSTRILIDELGPYSFVTITSSAAINTLDMPSFSTIEPGFAVRVISVPEPSSGVVLALASALFTCSVASKRC